MTKQLRILMLDLYYRFSFVEQCKVDPPMGDINRGITISTNCSMAKDGNYCRIRQYGPRARRKVKVERCNVMNAPAITQKVFYADNAESLVKYVLKHLDKPLCAQPTPTALDSQKGA